MRSFWLSFAALVSLMVGCGEIPATNPHDPNTPASQIAKGTVSGTVELVGDFNLDVLEAVVELRDQTAPAEVAYSAPVSEGGTFLFDTVVPGPYTVNVIAQGFSSNVQVVSVPIGGTVEGVAFQLLPVTDGAIRGVARLAGDQETGHGGLLVEVVGKPFTAVTSDDGGFQIAVTTGVHEVRVTRAGYQPASVSGVEVTGGQTAILDAPLILVGQPGSVRATVLLRRFSSAERLQAVDVGLWTDPPGDTPVATERPTGEGQIVFDAVVPGTYLVRADAEGYTSRALPVLVGPGERAQAGVLDLSHQSDTEDAVAFAGAIRLDGADQHAGTQVRVSIAGADIPFGPALVTNADGGFEVSAAPEERYMVSVVRRGYEAPAAMGPYAWNVDSGRFEAEGLPLDLTLQRNPVAGQIELQVAVLPTWIPLAERFARVRIDGEISEAIERVTHGESVSFGPLPEGVYSVSVERLGFTTATRVVQISPAATTHDLGLQTIELNDLALARLDLRGELVGACSLRSGISLRGADLSGARLVGDFGRGADCPAGVARGALDLTQVNLVDADLTQGVFVADEGEQVLLVGADLSGADLSGVDMRGVDARGADLLGANVEGTNFAGADVRGANFTGAQLRGVAFVARGNPPGGGSWPEQAESLEPIPPVPCTLRQARPAAQLDGAVFARADLSDAFMVGLDLSGATFAGARLSGADLRHTCLAGAQLTLLDLSDAVLDGADLGRAELTGALLRRTSLRGVNLTDASLLNTVIDQADIRLSPRGVCRAPADWAEYEEGGACDGVFNGLCNCRTRMNGVSLDGANLVGASFQGVDLADTSMLGVTFGLANRRAFIQPPSCQPGAYFDCMALWHIRGECDAAEPPMSYENWQGRCDANPALTFLDLSDLFQGQTNAGAVDCVLNTYQSQLDQRGECVEDPFALCLEGRGDASSTWPRQEGCSWSEIAGSDQADAGDVCEFGGRANVMPKCLLAPTVLEDTRLDRAEMVAVALNGVELRDSRLNDTVLRNGVFVNNQFVQLDFSGANFTEASLSGTDLREHTFTGATFSGAQLRQVDFTASDLTDVDFTDAVLRGAVLSDLQGRPLSFDRADLRDARMDGLPWAGGIGLRTPTFVDVDLSGSWIRDAQLDGANFMRADFSGTNLGYAGGPISLRIANLTGATFAGVRAAVFFDGANLEDATFSRAEIYQSSFIGANLGGARMRDVEAGRRVNLRASFAGARMNRMIIDDSVFIDVNFSRPVEGPCGDGLATPRCAANMDGVHGARNDFSFANFEGVCMRDVVLTDSEFMSANLSNSYMVGADFNGSALSNADLSNSDITDASFQGAQLSNADLTLSCGVNTFGIFNGANLSRTRICSTMRRDVEARNNYFGTPEWVACRPGGCAAAASCNF